AAAAEKSGTASQPSTGVASSPTTVETGSGAGIQVSFPLWPCLAPGGNDTVARPALCCPARARSSAVHHFVQSRPVTTVNLPAWGNMLTGASNDYLQVPLLPVAPGAVLVLAILAVNFIGDGLRDALDPFTEW